MRTKTLIVGTALAAVIFLAGCGADAADSGSSSGSGSDKAAAGPQRAVAQAPEAAQGQAQDNAAKAPSPDLSVDQRQIVYRGSIGVRVKDVTAAASQATGIATTSGGFIGSDQRTKGSGDDVATLTLRVPAGKFATVVDQVSKLGEEQNREINTEDVTEQSVDLDARIAVQQARVDSGRKLLAQAKSLSDLVMLEKEVATRESDLASLQAKQRNLADLVTLSTITVTLLSPQAALPAPPAKRTGFLGGLASGWHALLASLAVLLTVIGALLPWMVVLVLPALAVLYLIRRRNAHAGDDAAPRETPSEGAAG